MKRALLLFLLISVGLNIGLAVSLKRSRDVALDPRPWPVREGRPVFDDPDILRPGPPGRFGGERLRRMREMHQRLSPELVQHRQSLLEARMTLREALGREDMDEAEILGLVGAMVAAQGRIDSLVASSLVQELREMTPMERDEILRRLPWMHDPLKRRGRGYRPVSP